MFFHNKISYRISSIGVSAVTSGSLSLSNIFLKCKSPLLSSFAVDENGTLQSYNACEIILNKLLKNIMDQYLIQLETQC